MGLFKKIKSEVKNATKTVSRGVMDGVKFGATAPLEYLTIKPLEAIAPKVLNLAGRAKALVGQASEVQRIAQSTVAENQGLFSSLAGGDLLGGLFGGGAPVDGGMPPGGQFTAQPASVPSWVWIVGAIGAALGLFLLLKKKP